MKKDKAKVRVGSVLKMKDIIDNEIEILSNEEYETRNKVAVEDHQKFLDCEEWRKYIKWKQKNQELFAVNTGVDQYTIKAITTYYNTLESIMHIQENLDALFKWHPLLNKFRYDSFAKKPEYDNEVYDEDTKPQEIFNFFKRNFNEWCPRQDIKETIQESLNNNKFHPLIDWLNSLVWDGTDRLETFLIDYYNADDTKLNRTYFKRWMIAAIKRILNPGAKFDAMLILAGEQGTKKSTLLYWLGTINGKKYYNEVPDNLKDVNNLIYSSKGKIIMTFDDFDDICNKGDIGKIKSFITEQSRTAALKWQHEKDYPVTYVLGATTNQYNMLVDDAAFDERRFWIVKVNPTTSVFDIPDEIKFQLYAEAYHKYLSDPDQRLWIWEDDLKQEEIELQKHYKKAATDPLTEKIMSIFNRKYPISDGKFKSYNHFAKCMTDYNEMYNHDLSDMDIINNQYGKEQDIFGTQMDYVKDIPSAWIIELFALGKRSTDRIVQILHTQGLKATKKRCFEYGARLTHIWVEYPQKYDTMIYENK